jgi:probable phosphoglycerate mutase
LTILHLLRHGERESGRVLVGRTPGIALTERGRAEIAAVAGRLVDANIAAIYASPLQRTRETAEILSERLSLPVEYRDGLTELDFGEWTGSTFDQIRDDPRWPLWRDMRSVACIPGGESMREVQRRAVEEMFDIHARHGHDAAVIVSHGDVIRAALMFALGMPLDFYRRIEIAQASVSTIQIEPNMVRVLRMNERPHL